MAHRTLILALLAVVLAPAVAAGATPDRIGVILHDHGAPRVHNAESYYGMKWFLDELVNMTVIPAFVRDGFPFDPNRGNRGVILMDRNLPYAEVPWADLQLMDAWGNDLAWLKDVDADPSTPVIDPVYTWVAGGTDMYRHPGHYRIAKSWRPTFPDLLGWEEQDFFEFAGFDFYANWQKKGGIEIYYDQVLEQRQRIRDEIWRQYRHVLTGKDQPDEMDKEMYVRLTQGIDDDFPGDPAMSHHAQSLHDAVMMLVMDHDVKTIVVSEYFMFLSRMMNDEMDRMTVMDALMELEMMGHGGVEVVWAPDKLPIGDWEVPVYECTQWPPAVTQVGTETVPAYVGGVAFSDVFLKEVADKVRSEVARLPADAGDVALFLSNHGTPTTLSFCFDSAHDYIHHSYKAVFLKAAERIARRLGAVDLVFGPAPLSQQERRHPLNIETLSKDIQWATARLNHGRTIRIYRTSGQSASGSSDPGGLALSPREALSAVVDANRAGARFTHVVDLLYNFFGDSGDLLLDHRIDGYGGGDEGDPLCQLSWQYCNPFVPSGDVHDCSLPAYVGLEPYESEFVWDGVAVRITNATWGFAAKERAVADVVGAGIQAARRQR